MRQLSGHDAGFLYADTAHANANVSLLHIHDQSTAPGGVVRFKSILAHIERRLSASPLFRQRLQRVPLGLDHPYWVDDDDFDLEYHVRHIALPKPGDWRQFCIQVSRIHARPLDLDRPLWEAYVIEGLDSFLDLPAGSFALLFKTHLAAVDLHRLGALSSLLYDTSAHPPAPPPPEPWFADSPPGRLSLVRHGLVSTVTSPLRLARPLLRAATSVAPAAAALASEMLLRPQNLPTTRFNSVVSPHRVFETRRFTEAEFESIRALVPGASVDDAVAAVCGGALRRYLDAQGELPEGHSLAAIVPEPEVRPAPPPPGSARRRAEPVVPLAWRHVRLGTDIADARKRLAFVHQQTVAGPDEVALALGSRALAEAGEQASASLLAWSRRLAIRAGARLGTRTPPANCTLAYVPAPPQAMYLCGARLSYFSAILPINDGLGLAFAVTRYDGRLVISPTSCRELMPDPEVFAQCVRDSFQEYLALAQAAARKLRAPRKAPSSSAPAKTVAPRKVRAAAQPRPAAPRASSAGTARRANRPG
ncbi:MAG: acyltransferase [Burkholderiales bacterium RIFCSPHIGHO2_12_FULL_69_20]|nr:MAG: acyltransferase [Burkholderiales bacterium RIFCSPHIGHO2_12_FULL_69_20]